MKLKVGSCYIISKGKYKYWRLPKYEHWIEVIKEYAEHDYIVKMFYFDKKRKKYVIDDNLMWKMSNEFIRDSVRKVSRKEYMNERMVALI